ncbi:MAG: antitoxin FitA [Actinomycetota bacterium]|jgi:plasmid stability protein
MSVAITIRDVPDETRNELAARAARNGQSMQEYLRRELIEIAARPLQSEVLARIVSRNRASDSHLSRKEIVNLIREDRDAH